MAFPNHVAKFAAAEYLAWEQTQPSKHEFLAGEVFAMVGATDPHNTVALNLASLIKAHLRSGPCRVYVSDMKVRVEAADAYFYPDVVVTSDDRDHANRTEKRHPKLVVEILSESTGDFDRGEKFAIYRKIPELEEYALIDPELHTADVFRRADTGEWRLWDARGGSEIRFESIGLSAAFAEVFENAPRREL
jgi:Uma2 family endonuclease